MKLKTLTREGSQAKRHWHCVRHRPARGLLDSVGTARCTQRRQAERKLGVVLPAFLKVRRAPAAVAVEVTGPQCVLGIGPARHKVEPRRVPGEGRYVRVGAGVSVVCVCV